MIVICTGCQARFRVADEKVGPRGAKVRCSRCQTVFLVKRDAAQASPAAPGIELDLTPGLRGPSQAGARPGAAQAGAAVIPFPMAPSQPRPPPPDPFAAAGLEAFGEPVPAAGDDPFAQAAGPSAAAPGLVGPGEPFPQPDDPFAQAAAAPAAYGALSSGTTGAQSLPVTDLSQLLGPSAQPPPAAPAAPEPLPPQLGIEPHLGLGPQLRAEPELGFEPRPAVEAQPAAEARFSGTADLALEEHSGEHQAPFADPSDVMMSAEPGAAALGGAAWETGSAGAFGGPEESLALATEPTPGPAEPDGPAPMPVPAPRAAPVPRRSAPAPGADEPEQAEEEDRRKAGLARGTGTSAAQRLRGAAVNALALVALLAIALAFRVVLRGEASLGPSALRPSTLLRALRGAPREAGGFEVARVRTGVYPQSSGSTVLFVRGEVVSRAPGPLGAVKVEAELVRDGQVLARGEARAGAVPTPEEVDRASSQAALDQLGAALRKRAPRSVSPGDRLAFLVVLGDAPADVSGTSVRVRAEAEPAGAAP